MRVKNKKARRILWEARRHLVILAFYAVFAVVLALAVCFIVSVPEIVASLIF